MENNSGTGRRRVTVSKNGISENSLKPQTAQVQHRPSSRAPKIWNSEGGPNFSHFRGADNPNWAFSKESNEQPRLDKEKSDKKVKVSIRDTQDFTQNLFSRIKDIDTVADEMVSKVENMKKDMVSRKEMDELTDNFNGPNRLRIVTQVKREIRKNKRILVENRELRQCLAEHQTVLEMVMNKFRRVSAHAARLEKEHSSILERNGISDLKLENQRLTERVGEMLSLMSFAISHDAEKTKKWADMNYKIHRLQSENNNLRMMLRLSKGFGSYQTSYAIKSEEPTSIIENNVDFQNDSADILESDSSSESDEDGLELEEEEVNGEINGDIDIITSIIENQLNLKRDGNKVIQDISDVESTTSTVIDETALTEVDEILVPSAGSD